MAKNKQLKMRKQNDPYEVWKSFCGQFEWKVLKKWQLDDNKPYGRWFCATKGPGTFGSYELGDEYVARIKREGYKVAGEGRP